MKKLPSISRRWVTILWPSFHRQSLVWLSSSMVLVVLIPTNQRTHLSFDLSDYCDWIFFRSDICGEFGQRTEMCPLCDKTCPFWKLSDSCTYAQVKSLRSSFSSAHFFGINPRFPTYLITLPLWYLLFWCLFGHEVMWNCGNDTKRNCDINGYRYIFFVLCRFDFHLLKDSVDFDGLNEPMRPEFEQRRLPKRENPRTGVSRDWSKK